MTSWRTADVDAGLERAQERALVLYEAEQDRLQVESDEYERARMERQYDAAMDDARGIGDGLGI